MKHTQLNSWSLPTLTLVLVVVQIVDPSYIWQALIVGLGGVWLVGWLWARTLKRSLRLTREMRFAWAQVGDKLEEQFTLKNDGALPATWVEIIDHSTLPGYSAKRVTGVDPRSSTAWHTFAVCTRRGVYQLGGTTLRSGDPFGIYTIEIHQAEATVLVVMPPIISLPFIEVTPDGWIGEGRPRANALEQTVSATSVREYIPGDTMRLIHWPTSARKGALFVRMLEGAPAGDWWIVLDFDPNVQAGEDWDTTSELGVILAASLIDRGLRARRSVGLLASGKPPIWIRPQPGEHRRWELLRALAVLEPDGPSLAQILQRAGPTLARQTSLIIITPSTQSEWLNPLEQLCWRGISPTVLLMDASTFGASQSADSLAAALGDMGIPRIILGRELLHRPEARPGWHGQWKWRVTSTGKAIPDQLPGDLTWRRLG